MLAASEQAEVAKEVCCWQVVENGRSYVLKGKGQVDNVFFSPYFFLCFDFSVHAPILLIPSPPVLQVSRGATPRKSNTLMEQLKKVATERAKAVHPPPSSSTEE